MFDRFKKWRKKYPLRALVLVALLLGLPGVCSVCCLVSGLTSDVAEPTAQVVPMVEVQEPTTTPAPTAVPESTATLILEPEVPAADAAFVVGMAVCVNKGNVLPVLSDIAAAASSEPIDVAGVCLATLDLQTAAVMDKACWDLLSLPDDVHLQKVQQFYGLALDDYALTADLMLEFCASGNATYLFQATEAMDGANSLIVLATEAQELYMAP